MSSEVQQATRDGENILRSLDDSSENDAVETVSASPISHTDYGNALLKEDPVFLDINKDSDGGDDHLNDGNTKQEAVSQAADTTIKGGIQFEERASFGLGLDIPEASEKRPSKIRLSKQNNDARTLPNGQRNNPDTKRKSSMKATNHKTKPQQKKKASVSFAGAGEETHHERSRSSGGRKSVGFAVEPTVSSTKPVPRGSTSVHHDAKKTANKDGSVPNIPSGARPDWYEDIGESQINMFKEVFELLDKDGGGSIDAEELYACLKDLDIDISLEEIKNVLSELDSDGNGEIDFDEFLYAMSSTERYLSMLTSQVEGEEGQVPDDMKYNRRQTLFFTAITRFAMKNSLGDIERYYAQKMRQAPHVISCYTAGARLIGLNDRQLEKELMRMQKAAKDQDSPYAKPLPFVNVRKKKKVKTQQKKKTPTPKDTAEKPNEDEATSIQQNKKPDKDNSDDSIEHDDEILFQRNRARDRRRTAIYSDGSDSEILKALQKLAHSGNVVAKLPDVHLIPQIRTKLTKTKSADPSVLCSSMRKKRKSHVTMQGRQRPHTANVKHKEKKQSGRKPHGWKIPCIERGKAPLPVVKVERGKAHNFTVEDVAGIRKKVSGSVDKYYNELKTSLIKTAWDHWDQLHTDEIPSDKLRENFRKVYEAYSPHTMKDVFTICPWIPGPRYSIQPYRSATPTSPALMYISQTKATHHLMIGAKASNTARASASAPTNVYSRPPSRSDSTTPTKISTTGNHTRCAASPVP